LFALCRCAQMTNEEKEDDPMTDDHDDDRDANQRERA
jgi:hypothetical protein